MLPLFKKIRFDFFAIFLIFLSVTLCYLNYSPNTILSGWDTLHPEFNLSLYIDRILSVWQSHQGLGAPPAQAHLAELPRMIMVWIFTLVFPLSFVRYAYFFSMIILGPLGVYYFLNYIFAKEKQSPLTTRIASCLGGIFYLFNVGTMQHFITPLEMFATKFGFLGFLYLFAVKFLDNGTKKALLWFGLVTVLASPMAHTSTLWYVYFAGLALFSISYATIQRSKLSFKRSAVLIILSLLLNAYWIMPNVYYGLNYGDDLRNSKIHRLFSQEAYSVSKKYGNIADLAQMKNFLFDWSVFNNDQTARNLLSPWIQHLSNPYIYFISLIFPLLGVLGLVIGIKKRNRTIVSLLPLLLVIVSFMLSGNRSILLILNRVIEQNAILQELFRFPFTKFSLYFIFILSIFFAYAQKHLLDLLIPRVPTKYIYTVSSTFFYSFVLTILIYMAPAIQGQFISPIVRVTIPTEYFSIFNLLNKHDDGRVLTLPMNTLFGWSYYSWPLAEGRQLYQGAGFSWFGIKQPTLNREFDRWYPYNEQSYRELSYALYSNSTELFNKLLKKYNITYILLDQNAISPNNNFNADQLLYSDSKKIISSIQTSHLIQSFGKINLYRVGTNPDDVYVLKNARNIEPIFKSSYIDNAFSDFGDYVSDINSDKASNIYYPARALLKSDEKIDSGILEIKKDAYRLQFSNKAQRSFSASLLSKTEKQIYADIFLNSSPQNKKTLFFRYALPYAEGQEPFMQKVPTPDLSNTLLSLNDTVVTIPKNVTGTVFLGETSIYTNETNKAFVYNKLQSGSSALSFSEILPFLCSDAKENQLFGASKQADGFRLYSQNAKVCADIPLVESLKSNLAQNSLLELSIDLGTPNNDVGTLCLFDSNLNRCTHQKNITSDAKDNGTIRILLPIELKKLPNLALRFTLDNIGNNSMSVLSVLSLRASIRNPIDEIHIAPELSGNKSATNPSVFYGDLPAEQFSIPAEKITSELRDCSLVKSALISRKLVQINRTKELEYESRDGVLCDALTLPNSSQNAGHILGFESENISGLPMKFCLQQENIKKCILEGELSNNKKMGMDYFIVPPYYQSSGNTLIMKNISLSHDPSVNRLKKIQLIPFPYNYLQSIKNTDTVNPSKISSRHPVAGLIRKTLSGYVVEVKLSQGDTIVINQAYGHGWIAFIIKPGTWNIELLNNHVLVNNWANGWILNDEELRIMNQESGSSKTKIHNSPTIILIFWPQYLEYLGFIMLILTPLLIWRIKAKSDIM